MGRGDEVRCEEEEMEQECEAQTCEDVFSIRGRWRSGDSDSDGEGEELGDAGEEEG